MPLLRTRKHVPIVGVANAGKTYFITTMVYFVSIMGWGTLDESCTHYFEELLGYVLRGEPIPPTKSGIKRVILHVDRVVYGGVEKRVKFTLSTADISGAQFETAMIALNEQISSGGLERESTSSRDLEEVLRLLRRVHGLIAIVDITRHLSDTSSKKKAVLKALGQQAVPLLRAFQYALGHSRSRKPLFLVFTKKDIHGMEGEELEGLVRYAYAPILAILKKKGVIIRCYAVTSVGWSRDDLSFFKGEGFDKLLYDLAVELTR